MTDPVDHVKQNMPKPEPMPYMRLALFAILALLLFVSARALVTKISSAQPPVPPKASESPRPDGSGAQAPAGPPGPEISELGAEALLDVEDNTSRVEGPALRALLAQAQKMTGQEPAEKVAWADLRASATKYRGMPIRVEGTLYQLSEKELDPNPTGLRSVVWGILTDAEMNRYICYLAEKPRGIVANDDVKLTALFLKMLLYKTQKVETEVAVVVGKCFDRPAYLDDPSILKTMTQGTKIEIKPFNYLVSLLAKTPLEELKRKALRGVRWTQFVNEAEAYAGKFVCIEGSLLLCEAQYPDYIYEKGYDKTYWGIILSGEENLRFYTFYSLDKPLDIQDRDRVRIYGVFAKNWVYTAQNSVEVTSPIIIGKQMVKVRYPRVPSFVYWVTGIVFLVVIFVLVGVFAGRKGDREYQALRSKLRHHENDQSPPT